MTEHTTEDAGGDHWDLEKLPDTVAYFGVSYDDETMEERALEFFEDMNCRRSIRDISDKAVPQSVIEMLLKTASTSPSGGHSQPWTYVVVKTDNLKEKIKDLVEQEEQLNVNKKQAAEDGQPPEKQSKTANWTKPYLAKAPYLVLVMVQNYGLKEDGTKIPHYYSDVSTSISIGFLLAAIQNAGLVTVATTPMNAGPAICKLLDRPENEKLLLLLPIGHADKSATVPALERKPLENVAVFC